MRRWLRVLFVGVLALLVSIDSASACRFLRNRCRPRCRTVACFRPRPACHGPRHAIIQCPPAACSPCAAPDEIISISTPQCCVPADGSAHAEIVAPATEGIVESVIESAPAEKAPAKDLAAPAPVAAEKPAPAPLTPVPVAPASAEQPVPAPQFKTAKEILEESAAKEAAEKAAAEKAAAEAKAIAEAKASAEAKAAEEVLAEEEAAEPAAEEPAEPVEEEKPVTEEAPEEEPATEEPAEEPAPKEAAEKEPAEETAAEEEEEEENLFDETDGDADDKAKPAAEDPADEPAEEKTEEKTEEPKEEDDPFASILRAPSEPVRRWIDNTGIHETIGRLVEVHPDHIRILKANGRYATVPFTRLSRHDQDYVTATGARIAAEQRSQPAVHETAGL